MSTTSGMHTIDEETVKARQAAAAKQADHDHHVPTAGAMSGHVLANLAVLQRKLAQFSQTLSGSSSDGDRKLLTQLATQAQQHSAGPVIHQLHQGMDARGNHSPDRHRRPHAHGNSEHA